MSVLKGIFWIMPITKNATTDGHLADLTVKLESVISESRNTGVEITLAVNSPLGDICESQSAIVAIIKEALNNIIKHAKAKQAEIRVDVLSHATLLFIQDDGQGFEINKAMTGQQRGLIEIYRQVASLQGNITLETAPSQGTVFWITFPRLLP